MHFAFKQAATYAQPSRAMMAGIHVLTRTPGWMAIGAICFVSEALLYTVALRFLDLSVAFPAGSLTFVGVVLLSWLWLGESVGPRRWTGMGLITIGTVLLGIS